MKNLLYFLYYVVAPIAIVAVLLGIFYFICGGGYWLHGNGDYGNYVLARFLYIAFSIIADAFFYLSTFDIFNKYMKYKNF